MRIVPVKILKDEEEEKCFQVVERSKNTNDSKQKSKTDSVDIHDYLEKPEAKLDQARNNGYQCHIHTTLYTLCTLQNTPTTQVVITF
jgi:hypothetical protein